MSNKIKFEKVINDFLGIIVLIFLITFMLSCNNSNSKLNLYGDWQGEFGNYELLFSFKSDHTCELNFYDASKNELTLIKGDYEFDLSKKPIPLSIRNSKQLEHPLHTIIKFQSADSIKMSEFSTKLRLRPITFTKGKYFVISRLKKIN